MAALLADDNPDRDEILDNVALANRDFFQEYFMNEDSEDECVEFVGFTLNEDHDGNFDNDSALDLDDNANGNVDGTQSADTTSTTTKTKKKNQLPFKLQTEQWNSGNLKGQVS